MFIQQIYTNCLAEAAYYIESEGEGVIIDPIRETQPYLSLLQQRNASLKYIFETHFHADFVSGHLDLAAKTNTPIIFGPVAETSYNIYHAADGEVFTIGRLAIKVLHTPGHTPESVCYLLYNEEGKPHAVFTGDTLLIGDVGRPHIEDDNIAQETLAGMLFDSLQTKLKTLPDSVLVYPAHIFDDGIENPSDKNTFSTIGTQKQTNFALQVLDKQIFISEICEESFFLPSYFAEDISLNKQGYEPLEKVLESNMNALSLKEFKEKSQLNNVVILDTRKAEDFEKGFVPDSLNVGLDGQYGVWVGTLIEINCPILLICYPGTEQEAITRLARIGYENVLGFLEGGFSTWFTAHQETEVVDSIDADDLREFMKQNPDAILLDVRRESEFKNAHVAGATHISLADLPARRHDFEPSRKYVVYCGGGYRSMIAVSLLKIFGVDCPTNINGGFEAISEEEDIQIEKTSERGRITNLKR
jgi:glyoxylase-like metal-dependent hydrolase (beta-lactamase superfamily II)/rhodanese-related sulfurtransferase